MMRTIMRVLFYVSVTIFWSLVIVLALELQARWRKQDILDHAPMRVKHVTSEGRKADAQAVRAILPDYDAFEKARDSSLWKTLEKCDLAEWPAFAAEQGWVLLACTGDGILTKAIVPDSVAPELKAYASELVCTRPVTLGMRDATAADMLEAIRSVLKKGQREERDYPFTAKDERRWMIFMEFSPSRLPESPVVISVRQSIWDILWYRFRPNTHQNSYMDVRINGLGWRDREIPLPKSPDTVRIVCVGGSTTAWGPVNEVTYPKILEGLLRERFPGRHIEVVNAGVFGLDSIGEKNRSPDYLALEPDIIVHYNVVNDLSNMMPLLLHSPSDLAGNWHVRRWASPREMRDVIVPFQDQAGLCGRREWLHRSAFLHLRANAWLLPEDSVLKQGLRDYTLNNMTSWMLAAHRDGVAMAVCSFAAPDPEKMDRSQHDYFNNLLMNSALGEVVDLDSHCHVVELYNQLVRELCAQSGFTYIPVAENVHGGMDYFLDICHFYCPGMEKQAQAITEGVAPLVEQLLAEKQAVKRRQQAITGAARGRAAVHSRLAP